MPRNLAPRRRQILQAISALTTGAQRRYPTQLRSSIVAYSRARVQAGTPLTRVCSEIGVSHPTLVRFLAQTPAPMRPVRVAPAPDSKPERRAALVVRGPGGLVIDGLDIEDIAALVRALA